MLALDLGVRLMKSLLIVLGLVELSVFVAKTLLCSQSEKIPSAIQKCVLWEPCWN